MSGTTYPRTSGTGLLPGTWAYVQAHAGHADEALKPGERTDYEAADPSAQATFRRLMAADLTRPPDFLRFALTAPQLDADVRHDSIVRDDPPRLFGTQAASACKQLCIDPHHLELVLAMFAGDVTLTQLDAGTTLYRVVGLTAKNVDDGLTTNRLLGDYWMVDAPDTFKNLADWRTRMAVLPEWNGDCGFVRITLRHKVWSLTGRAGPQAIPGQLASLFPGGGAQCYIPHLSNADLVSPLDGVPLREVILATGFSEC